MKHYAVKAASDQEHREIRDAAEAAGMSISNYWRQLAGKPLLPENGWKAQAKRAKKAKPVKKDSWLSV